MSLHSKFNSSGGITRWDGKHFIFELSIPEDNYGIALYVSMKDPAYNMTPTSTYVNPITMDWGDGSIEQYSSGTMRHTYSSAGEYRVTLYSSTGKMPLFEISPPRLVKRILTPLLTCYTGNNPRKTFSDFMDMSECRSIPKKFFIKNPQITSLASTFESFGWSRQCFLPPDLFKYTPNVTDMSSLLIFSNVTILPKGLFDNCPHVKSFKDALDTTNDLEGVEPTLFDNCKEVTDFSGCFGSVKEGTILPRLWERTNVTSYEDCFYYATKAANYVEVPYGWGGPSRVTFNVTPSDANIDCTLSTSGILTQQGTTYIGCDNNSTFKYKISREGYLPQEGTVEAGDNTLDIVLEERNITVTISTSIEGMKVLLTAYGETVESNNIKVAKGATVTWETVSDYYGSKSGTITNIQEDTTEKVQYTDRVTLYSLNTGANYTSTGSGALESGFDTTYLYRDDTSQTRIFDHGGFNACICRDNDEDDAWGTQNTAHVVLNPVTGSNPQVQIGTTCISKNFANLTNAYHFGESNYTLTKDIISNNIPSSDGQFIGVYTTDSTGNNINKRDSATIDIEEGKAYYLNMFIDAPTTSNALGTFATGVNYVDVLIDRPDNWETFKLGFDNSVPDATITLKYKGLEYSFTNGDVCDPLINGTYKGDGSGVTYFDKKIDKNTLVYYKVEKEGYYTVDGWIRIEKDDYIRINSYPYFNVEHSYPFDTLSEDEKEKLEINNGSFAINDTLEALVSQNSYHKPMGASYGYLHGNMDSRSDNPQLIHVEVDAYVSSQKNGDYGSIMIGSSQGMPTVTQMKNQTSDGYWTYMMCQSGTDNTIKTYSIDFDLLEESRKWQGPRSMIGEAREALSGHFVLSFAYAKNLLTNSGEDRLIITRIKIQTVEDSLDK